MTYPTIELAIAEAERQQQEHDDYRLVLLLTDGTHAVMTWSEYLQGLGRDLNPLQVAWDGTATDEYNLRLVAAACAFLENHRQRKADA